MILPALHPLWWMRASGLILFPTNRRNPISVTQASRFDGPGPRSLPGARCPLPDVANSDR